MTDTETKFKTQEAIKNINQKGLLSHDSIKLGQDDTSQSKSPNFKTKVKIWTKDDKQTHSYFHSFNIDVQVTDFVGTAELRCPYDSDLMEYWEVIRNTCVIYGSNKGKYKILFVGRVREIKQDGYEISITLQNYAWKFKQQCSKAFVEENVLGKDGYSIMRAIFEVLKIDSWVISPSAKKRLKEVGMNSEGNLTLNGKEVEEIPDLLERLKEVDMSKVTNEWTLHNKIKENTLSNIKDINYSVNYQGQTAKMQQISEKSDYTEGSTVYEQTYGSPSPEGTGNTSTSAGTASEVGADPYYEGEAGSQSYQQRCASAYKASLGQSNIRGWSVSFGREVYKSYNCDQFFGNSPLPATHSDITYSTGNTSSRGTSVKSPSVLDTVAKLFG